MNPLGKIRGGSGRRSRRRRSAISVIVFILAATYTAISCWNGLQQGVMFDSGISTISRNNRRSEFHVTSKYGGSRFSSSRDCYLDLETKKSGWIDKWLEQDAPLMDAVLTKRLQDEYNRTFTVYQITIIMKHLTQNDQYKHYWDDATWYCNRQENPGKLTVSKAPVHLVECTFYDPNEILHTIWPSKVSTKTNGTVRYPMMAELARCYDQQHREDTAYFQAHHHDKVEPLLTACTIVRGANENIPPWVEYHRLLGYDYFWIFVNEPFPEQPWIQRPYVKFIPYNYYWNNHKMHSTSYRKPKIDVFWQESMQMQCLYHAKSFSNIEWLTTTDVDEYIFVNSTGDMNRPFPLKSYLKDHRDQYSHLAGMVMNSVFFGRHPKQKPGNATLLMDYTYRHWEPKWQRYKVIYQPRTALAAEVHYVRGGERIRLQDIYFQHYKKADQGVAKTKGGTKLIQDTRLRDRYRQRVWNALYGTET